MLISCSLTCFSPPKIKSIRIIDNPFPDIIPRITAAERRAQQRAREEAQKEREEYELRKNAKKFVFYQATKIYSDDLLLARNVKLLSFGADEGGEEDEPVTFKKKAIVRPDCKNITYVHGFFFDLVINFSD